MFKRARWTAIGFTAGVASSWAVAHQVRRVAQRYTPPAVVDRWSGNVKSAVGEGRSAMREREVDLRAGLERHRNN